MEYGRTLKTCLPNYSQKAFYCLRLTDMNPFVIWFCFSEEQSGDLQNQFRNLARLLRRVGPFCLILGLLNSKEASGSRKARNANMQTVRSQCCPPRQTRATRRDTRK